jgi:hypothetical protein
MKLATVRVDNAVRACVGDEVIVGVGGVGRLRNPLVAGR